MTISDGPTTSTTAPESKGNGDTRASLPSFSLPTVILVAATIAASAVVGALVAGVLVLVHSVWTSSAVWGAVAGGVGSLAAVGVAHGQRAGGRELATIDRECDVGAGTHGTVRHVPHVIRHGIVDRNLLGGLVAHVAGCHGPDDFPARNHLGGRHESFGGLAVVGRVRLFHLSHGLEYDAASGGLTSSLTHNREHQHQPAGDNARYPLLHDALL